MTVLQFPSTINANNIGFKYFKFNKQERNVLHSIISMSKSLMGMGNKEVPLVNNLSYKKVSLLLDFKLRETLGPMLEFSHSLPLKNHFKLGNQGVASEVICKTFSDHRSTAVMKANK